MVTLCRRAKEPAVLTSATPSVCPLPDLLGSVCRRPTRMSWTSAMVLLTDDGAVIRRISQKGSALRYQEGVLAACCGLHLARYAQCQVINCRLQLLFELLLELFSLHLIVSCTAPSMASTRSALGNCKLLSLAKLDPATIWLYWDCITSPLLLILSSKLRRRNVSQP